jgi:hypothetical protein
MAAPVLVVGRLRHPACRVRLAQHLVLDASDLCTSRHHMLLDQQDKLGEKGEQKTTPLALGVNESGN